MELKPIRIPTQEWELIEDKIKLFLKKFIYLPILKEMGYSSKTLKNSLEDLMQALQSSKITFSRGQFSGQFNSTISKELRKLGAEWNRSKKTYSILQKDLPYEIRTAIGVSESRFAEKLKRIDQRIDTILPQIEAQQLIGKIKMDHFFDRSLWTVNKSFEESVKKITVAPQLSDESAENMRQNWRDNMDLKIKGIADEILPKLRKEIQQNIYEGNRYGALIDTLERSYNLSAKRAKYVARNETNLFMAKFKQERLAEVGVHKYKWKCVKGSPGHKVRPMHLELTKRSDEGEIFDFRNPPEADPKVFYNPHERNNCRCSAIPIIQFNQGKKS